MIAGFQSILRPLLVCWRLRVVERDISAKGQKQNLRFVTDDRAMLELKGASECEALAKPRQNCHFAPASINSSFMAASFGAKEMGVFPRLFARFTSAPWAISSRTISKRAC